MPSAKYRKRSRYSPNLRPIVAALRLLMAECDQSYHFMAIHYGHSMPSTGRGVSKQDKNSILTHALRKEMVAQAGSFRSSYEARLAVERWIKTFRPNLLEQLAIAAGDD